MSELICASCGRAHVRGVWWPRHPFKPMPLAKAPAASDLKQGDRVKRVGTIYIASTSEPRYCIRWDGDAPKRKEEWVLSHLVALDDAPVDDERAAIDPDAQATVDRLIDENTPPRGGSRPLPVATTDLAQHEAAVDLVNGHRFIWCRARLMHAMAAADEQGTVLMDVLEELLPDDDDAPLAIANALRDGGWTRELVCKSATGISVEPAVTSNPTSGPERAPSIEPNDSYTPLTVAEADRLYAAHRTCIERGQFGALVGCVGEIVTERLRMSEGRATLIAPGVEVISTSEHPCQWQRGRIGIVKSMKDGSAFVLFDGVGLWFALEHLRAVAHRASETSLTGEESHRLAELDRVAGMAGFPKWMTAEQRAGPPVASGVATTACRGCLGTDEQHITVCPKWSAPPNAGAAHVDREWARTFLSRASFPIDQSAFDELQVRLAEVRRETIEACAQVCDADVIPVGDGSDEPYQHAASETAWHLAKNIRALSAHRTGKAGGGT